MTREYPHYRRALPPDLWPADDRFAWSAAVRTAHVLDDPGRGSHWAAATRTRYQWAWGRYLTFLATTDQLSEEEVSAERITPGRVAAYVEALGDQVASGSMTSYLEALHNTIFALAPDHDWGWLR